MIEVKGRTFHLKPQYDRQQASNEHRQACEQRSTQASREAAAELLPPEYPVGDTVAHGDSSRPDHKALKV